ncbi:carbohydrate binding domain-containing protein [Klebsiella variicola]|nr:carbohydrate binding domain-containing protein [Klebsiella variicola]
MVRGDATSPGLYANNKKPVPQDGQRRYRYVVRAKGVSGAMNLLLRRWNFNGSVEGAYADKNLTLTTDWQTLTWETDLNQASGVDGAAFGMYCHPSNAEVWIDSFKVYDITDEVTIKANSDAISSLTNTVTQNGQDITAQANDLTQLKSSLTNDAVALAANPDNMLTNTGFERGSDNWTGFNAYSDIYAAQVPKSGAYILRGKAGGIAGIGQNVLNVKKGRTYRFGGYVKRNADMAIGAVGNNKFRLGNADTGAGPLAELNFSQDNVGTNWTLLTHDYVPSSDMTIGFSINWILTAGEVYFDDVFFVDVTDEINNQANATAITSLTTRVTSAEGKITSQGTAITNLENDLSTANGEITANADAIDSLQNTVTSQGNTITSQGQAITGLTNDLGTANGEIAANASALDSLQNTVTSQGDTITSQGQAITSLENGLNTANGKITANATAITNLTSRVTEAEGVIDSQAESITSINSSVKGIQTQAANLIPNPTMNPAYNQMGMVVVSSTSEGVPEGCPYAWVAKCSYRDHVPTIDNIPCHEGQVFEFSVLAACGTGSAAFQHYIGTASSNTGNTGSPQANGGQISAATGAQWTRTTWRWTVTEAQGAKGYFRPFLQIAQSGPDFGTVWYATDWQVRDVTAAAQANDKANANATAITQLTTRVTTAEGSITSQGQAITGLTNDLSDLEGIVSTKADADALATLTTRVTKAEGEIDSQGTAITQLSNSINATDAALDAQGNIPGNLLVNASFERDTVGFIGWGSLTSVITATQPHSGSKILKMAATGSAGVGQNVDITQGRRYRFGVFAKQDSNTVINDPGNTKFRIADSSGLLIGQNYGPFTADWQHVFMEWTATKTTTAEFQLQTWLSAGAMYFDDVYVIDITNETNIQANADAITSLDTKVTQQGNDLTSQGSAITQLTNGLTTAQYQNSNPWVDGTFESYADQQAIGGANAIVTTEAAFSGTQSLMCRRGDGESGNSDKTFGYETAVRESAVYRFECWAMMPEDETPPDGWSCLVGLMVRTSAGTAAWPTVLTINESTLSAGGGRGVWVKFTGKAGIGGAQKTRGRLWISNRGTAGGDGYKLYIDDLVITDVTDAHAAQNTADANATAITGLTTRVTSAEGEITSQGKAITTLTGDISTINDTLSQKADASAVTALQTSLTAVEGDIESQGSAITSLNNSLEAFSDTGENLVQNFDFLQGDTAYGQQHSSASTITFGDYGDGKAGVRMVRGDGTSPGLFANNKKPVPQDGQRRYRYIVRAKGVSGAMNLLLRRWNYSGSVEGTYADKNLALTTDWQTLTWETDLNQASGVDGAAFGMYCHPSNAEVWIDSFKVYDITDEVAIKANSDAISSLTNTVTQNGQDITAQANALTQLKSSLTNDAVALAANPDNMLTNSGFERGSDNWTGWGSMADVYAAQAPKSGVYILRGKAGGNASVGQNVLNVKKGRTYRFGSYVKRNADMAIGTNTEGNNKFRLGNADTGAGPLSELNFTQANVGTSWTLLTRDYVPSSDMTVAFSVNWNLSAGEVYFDDVFFVDVTDEINNQANATAITNLTTRVTSAEGKITSQGTAITNLENDLSTANGEITANASAIDSLQNTVTSQGNTITSQGQAITSLENGLSTANGEITANAKAISTLQNTVTSQGDSLTSQGEAITSLESDLSDLTGEVDTKASATALTSLTTRVTSAEGKITANTSALSDITSRVDDAESSIDGLNETVAENGLAMANGFQQLRAQIGDNQAAITQTNSAVADLESATAEQINTVQSSVDGMSATVQETSSTVADLNDKLGAQWGVKVATDSGGGNPRIAGIQLGIDATGSSQFLVQADTFAVYTGGNDNAYPFIVQGGAAYIQEALIRDGAITNAKIGNIIQSNNYVDGSTGWSINKDGGAQFNNVIVRGAVYATSGTFKGTLQADSFIGDIAVARRYDDMSFSRNNTVQRTGYYQNRGYAMTIVLSCTLVYQLTGAGNVQQSYTVDITFNIGGQEVTRKFFANAAGFQAGEFTQEFRFAADLDADNNNVSFFIKARGNDASIDYSCSIQNITATAFRTNSNSFS